MSYREVAQTLEDFITGHGGQWDWDDYLTATHFDDPYLKAVQLRMNGLSEEHPRHLTGYCNATGVAIIRQYVDELRAKAAEHHHN